MSNELLYVAYPEFKVTYQKAPFYYSEIGQRMSNLSHLCPVSRSHPCKLQTKHRNTDCWPEQEHQIYVSPVLFFPSLHWEKAARDFKSIGHTSTHT